MRPTHPPDHHGRPSRLGARRTRRRLPLPRSVVRHVPAHPGRTRAGIRRHTTGAWRPHRRSATAPRPHRRRIGQCPRRRVIAQRSRRHRVIAQRLRRRVVAQRAGRARHPRRSDHLRAAPARHPRRAATRRKTPLPTRRRCTPPDSPRTGTAPTGPARDTHAARTTAVRTAPKCPASGRPIARAARGFPIRADNPVRGPRAVRTTAVPTARGFPTGGRHTFWSATGPNPRRAAPTAGIRTRAGHRTAPGPVRARTARRTPISASTRRAAACAHCSAADPPDSRACNASPPSRSRPEPR